MRNWPSAALLALLAAGVAFAVVGQDHAAATGAQLEDADVVDDVVSLVDAGHFAKAESRIAAALADGATPAAERTALEIERERMRRIRLHLPLGAAGVQ